MNSHWEKQRQNFARGNAAVDDPKQGATRYTTTVEPIKHTCMAVGGGTLILPCQACVEESRQPMKRKHTCGIDGDPGAVTPLDGKCEACEGESKMNKSTGNIANPVCSKCGKQMVEPMPGEPYLCNNSSCPSSLPDHTTGNPKYLTDKSGLTDGELGFFNIYAEYESQGKATPGMCSALGIIRRLCKSNQELRDINFKHHVEHDGGPSGRLVDDLAELREANRKAFNDCFEYAGRLAIAGGATQLLPDLMGRLTQLDNIIAGSKAEKDKATEFAGLVAQLAGVRKIMPDLMGRLEQIDNRITSWQLNSKQPTSIRFNDPQKLIETLCIFRADLAKCYGAMGGPATKPTLEKCMKDTDILIELVKAGKESLEARERYKDRLARMVGRLWYKTASGTNVITHAVGLLDSIDKHCDERNK